MNDASVETLHAYWRNPDESNAPETYLSCAARSNLLIALVRSVISPVYQPSILELGCNCGRNLAALHNVGYERLSGIEINPAAVKLLRKKFRQLDEVDVWCGTIEEELERYPQVDIIYTMAVLEHVHPDSATGVFNQMTATAKKAIIVIEDEQGKTWRHFPRNYRVIFEQLGWRTFLRRPCDKVEGLGYGFVATVLTSPTNKE